MRVQLFLLFAALSTACGRAVSVPASPALAPPLVVGSFQDDYGERHLVSASEWVQQPASRYHIVRWVPERHYLIARNDSANQTAPGRWTRIDWLRSPECRRTSGDSASARTTRRPPPRRSRSPSRAPRRRGRAATGILHANASNNGRRRLGVFRSEFLPATAQYPDRTRVTAPDSQAPHTPTTVHEARLRQ